MINFKTIPFFKILLPYIFGILVAIIYPPLPQLQLIFLGSICVLVIAYLFLRFSKTGLGFKKWFFIASAHLFLFVLALESCFYYQAKHQANHYSQYVIPAEQSLIGIVDDLPVITDKSIKLSLQVTSVEEHNNWHYCKGNTIVYIKNDSTLKFDIGNTVYLNSKFNYINEPKNPNEFNYKQFLYYKNIYHTLYVKPQQISLLKQQPSSFSFVQFGTRIKAKVVAILRSTPLSQAAFSICTALLVGYDDEIDKDIMQSFSHSGTLHILSVSGMHTGLLYALIVSIFLFFDKYDRYKYVKCISVISALCLFVFITGFSPSVLRAALMLSLVMVGKTFYKQGYSYNTLFVSAFILLLFNPYLIMDAGFLLSYFAVFGIMYLYPILYRQYVFSNKIGQWFWNLILMSVAATVFTLPISLYFFHQFPIWFAFTNLLIIPMSMFLMAATALLLACYKITLLKTAMVYVINMVTTAMLWIAQLTDHSSYGYLDYLSFSKLDVAFCTLTLVLFFSMLYTKSFKQVVMLGVVIMIWLCSSITSNYKHLQQKELVVFHIKNKSAFIVRQGNKIYYQSKDLSTNDFQRCIKPYILNFSNTRVIPITSQILKFASTNVVHYEQASTILTYYSANYVIVSHNAPLQLPTHYKIKPVIIADCSNNYKFVKQLKKRCAQEGLVFYSIKENGAVTINL